MKRATVLVIIAVLALVLVYPASTTSARSARSQDTPIIITPENPGDTPVFAGTDDDGDADDLAGLKDRKSKPIGVSVEPGLLIRSRLAFEVWRMYFFAFELCR